MRCIKWRLRLCHGRRSGSVPNQRSQKPDLLASERNSFLHRGAIRRGVSVVLESPGLVLPFVCAYISWLWSASKKSPPRIPQHHPPYMATPIYLPEKSQYRLYLTLSSSNLTCGLRTHALRLLNQRQDTLSQKVVTFLDASLYLYGTKRSKPG